MRYTAAQTKTSPQELKNGFSKLSKYITQLQTIAKDKSYEHAESSINLPFEEKFLQESKSLAKKYVTSSLRYIVVVGIGGSNLGTKAIYDAFYGFNEPLTPYRSPKIVFMDTESNHFNHKLIEVLQELEPEELVINVISKSGITLETKDNMEVLLKNLPQHKDRIVITTNKTTEMAQLANTLGMDILNMPKKIGGRYSVMTNVGLFPLACCGFEIEKLLIGAQITQRQGLKNDLKQNLPAISAISKYTNYKKGDVINDHFFFEPSLETLGKWFRQLQAESIGKEGKGILPTVSVGSTDMHSIGQLYLGGEKNIYFTFISEKDEKNLNKILDAVTKTYIQKDVPFDHIELEDISLEEIGGFMQFKMLEIMFLAHLMEVNAFNQPNVEDYKINIKN